MKKSITIILIYNLDIIKKNLYYLDVFIYYISTALVRVLFKKKKFITIIAYTQFKY